MQSQWTLQDAKNKFSEVVNAACDGNPQVVTKRGVPSVVVVSVDAYEKLLACGKPSSSHFADFLLAMPETTEDDHHLETDLREVDF
jgi:prevent-host-death family protein